MTRGPGAARWLALLPGLVAASVVSSAAAGAASFPCVTLASHPDGAPLAELAAGDAPFEVSYVHSVTRTPVFERYRVDGDAIVETEMRFAQHGPGLPTQADAGYAFELRDGQFIVTMSRRFPIIVMRVHRDQSPRLRALDRDVDLAAWGNRSLALAASRCTAR
ncbi:MAG: DUF1850 domain-containing protein [Burkholderiales bacterium]